MQDRELLTDSEKIIEKTGEIGRVLREMKNLKKDSLVEAFICLVLGEGDNGSVVSGMEGPGISCVSMLVDFFGNNTKMFWAMMLMITEALQDPQISKRYPDWCDREELVVLSALVARRLGEEGVQIRLHDQTLTSDPNGRVGNA